ncbi:hypothetical protein [Symbioplanes lichenis]|uniref:hypothetical protein n=1 Tax=Symbioplanes lichenis TaxID=1629072 RepID=UPI0027396C93|nr:hypothetical protein [Actinoplanes lichenis]
MNLRAPAVSLTAAAMLSLLACTASYDERMKFLDDMSAKGITYRQQLQNQGTDPSEDACGKGWVLLKASIPSDDSGYVSDEWRAQAEEAYVKSCLTGSARPKPDPSGVEAVTPVPFGSEKPAPSTSR